MSEHRGPFGFKSICNSGIQWFVTIMWGAGLFSLFVAAGNFNNPGHFFVYAFWILVFCFIAHWTISRTC